MAYRGKGRLARPPMMTAGKGESIPQAGGFYENRRKSVCTFDFDGQDLPQCLQAVELRPDSIDIRMQPYALPLKGKGRKKVQLPKEAHKVHTDA